VSGRRQSFFLFFEKFFAGGRRGRPSTKIFFFFFLIFLNKKKDFADGRHSAKVWSLCRVPGRPSAKLGRAGKKAQLCQVLAVGKAG